MSLKHSPAVPLPADTPHDAPAARCWQRRLEYEREHGMESGNEHTLKTWQMRFLVRCATIGLKLIGLYERGRRNSRSPILRHKNLLFKDLPQGLDGVRILHLSDFHFPREDEPFMQAVTQLLDGVETDLCVLTGDYKYGHYGPPDRVPVHLARVLAGIQSAHGFQAILGNHDLAAMVPLLEGVGVTMLVNRGIPLSHAGTTLWLGGVDDPHKFHTDHLPSAFAGAPADAFKIALVHSPERAEEAAALGAHLYLCGHTHGGQLRLPLWGAIKLNSRSKFEYARGHWRCDGMQGYTTDGLGVTDFPLRFNCPPEACLFTLRRAGD